MDGFVVKSIEYQNWRYFLKQNIAPPLNTIHPSTHNPSPLLLEITFWNVLMDTFVGKPWLLLQYSFQSAPKIFGDPCPSLLFESKSQLQYNLRAVMAFLNGFDRFDSYFKPKDLLAIVQFNRF